MSPFKDNDAFFAALRLLIEKWCNRRCLKALHYIRGSYLAFNGMTDGWGELLVSFRNVRTFAKDELQPSELEELDVLIRTIDNVIAPKIDPLPHPRSR